MKRTLIPQPAKAVKWRPNIFLYGDAGTTKTVTALALAQQTGAKVLVIDTEKGATPYGGQFDFDLVQTESPQEVEAQLDYLLATPEPYTMLVVDPISCIQARLIAMAEDATRKARQIHDPFVPVLDPGVRAMIKRLQKDLMAKLKRLDMAKVVTARARPAYKVAKTGGQFQLEQVGTTWEGDASLAHEFDLVIQLLKYGTGDVVGKVEKARGLDLPQMMDPFSAGALLKHLDPTGFTDESEPRPRISSEEEERIQELIKQAGLAPGDLSRSLTRHGAETVADLPAEAATAVIVALETRVEQIAKVKGDG